MSSSLLCVFERIKYGLSVKSTQENHAEKMCIRDRHYYTVPGTFEKKTAATGFDTNTYYETIRKALYMDELITRHTEIMSHYDPEHKVGLVVDEWGTWYDVEPGTNPGFLYQQNTMHPTRCLLYTSTFGAVRKMTSLRPAASAPFAFLR